MNVIRGEDVVSMIALAAQWTAQTACRRELEIDGGWASQFETFPDIFEHCLRIIDPRQPPAPRAYVSAVAHAARKEWVPTLALLRTGEARTDTDDWRYADLVEIWWMFGDSFGLDEGNEMKRTRRLCAHRYCPLRMRAPLGALSSCRGCKETRYCGRECQRADWGAHKLVCGKRLTSG